MYIGPDPYRGDCSFYLFIVLFLLLIPPARVPGLRDSGTPFFFIWFLVCYAATQLAAQLPQRRIQVVRSNKVARKRLTESNGTPAMDLDVKKHAYAGIHKRRMEQNTQTQ